MSRKKSNMTEPAGQTENDQETVEQPVPTEVCEVEEGSTGDSTPAVDVADKVASSDGEPSDPPAPGAGNSEETPDEAASDVDTADEDAVEKKATAEPVFPGTSGNGEPSAEITSDRVVEAVLFASNAPLNLSKIVSILGTGSAREVRKIIQSLNETYEAEGHAFRVAEIAGGYQILTLPEYNTWLRRLKHSRQESKLSPAAMETLAVVAYKQPVVRAEVEAVRGVSAGDMLNRLRELGLVKIVGRADDVGRPMLYGTTRHFLEIFGLSALEDLPAVEELQMPK